MKRSIWTGFSIAPLTGPLAFGIIILLYPATYDHKEFNAETWFIANTITIVTSYISCFIVGAPLILLLKKYNKLNLMWLVLSGSILYSIMLNLILFFVMELRASASLPVIILQISLTGFAMGLLITLVFSYLAGIGWKKTL